MPAILTRLAPLERAIAEAYWRRSADSLEFVPVGWERSLRGTEPHQEWEESSRLDYRCPADTILRIGRHSVILDTVAKWYVARSRSNLLAAARHYFTAFAKEITASGFLVYHDHHSSVEECVYSGMSYEEVKAWIIANGARAAPSVNDLLLGEAQLRQVATAPDLFYEEPVVA